jgi:hypothetical protein
VELPEALEVGDHHQHDCPRDDRGRQGEARCKLVQGNDVSSEQGENAESD